MHKTIEAYYENGKIIYKEPMPTKKRAKILITILEEYPDKNTRLSRFKGILKNKVNGMEYQKKIRGEWE